MDPKAASAGLLVGFLVGLTGMGGAALMTPVLILLFGVRPIVAVGTDLAYGAVTKIVGAWQHHRQGTVDVRLGLLLAAASVPASLVGVMLTRTITESNPAMVDFIIGRVLGVALVLVALSMIARLFLSGRRAMVRAVLDSLPVAGHGHRTSLKLVLTIAWGIVVGFLVGLTSVGSGSLIVPFLALVYPISASRVVGTDVFQASMLVSVAALAHLYSGSVDLPLAGNLLLGSIPGVLLGSRLASRAPDRILR
ncbi:MAG: sulfite exporter TauE/SafE family protein, partial [Dehalococcoidia bacterium]|nr:sulfite exporter TauE/SafE family protein [Dehalococcoidia bacterium]